MDEQTKIFSRNLNNYILASGKTQKQVAKELGFHPTTFNTWCVGKIMPSLGKVQRIADYFGIGKSELTDEISPKPAEKPTAKDIELLKAYHSSSEETQAIIRRILDIGKGY